MFEQARLNRRTFMQRSAMAAAGAAATGMFPMVGAAEEESPLGWNPVYEDIVEMTVAEMQSAMEAGWMTSRQLTGMYLTRIADLDKNGPKVNSVIALNPDVLHIAEAMDTERENGNARGPLHGIPIILKDNIDTADGMPNTAGSLALANNFRSEDSTVAARLRAAGAVIIGKSNLSEWANFRGFNSSSGWSGLGRQTKNPYVLTHNPCGSSAGTGSAVAANFAAVGIGTETDGSIVCPSSLNALVGIKPTVGLTSRFGVIPISRTQDTIGPMTRTVADAAAVLGAIAGPDPRDPYTAASAEHARTNYMQFLDANGLAGARIGVARSGGYWGYSVEADNICNVAIAAMREMGAEIIDPANIPTADDIASSPAEFTVLLYEFLADLNAYLATCGADVAVHSLAELIEFNRMHAEIELPYFGQEILELAAGIGPLTDAAYLEALETSQRLSRTEGIDAVMDEYNLDALVAPTGSPSWPIDLINGDHFLGASSSPAAMAGYPLITVPAGDAFGLPVGLTFMGRAWSEPTLIKLAYAFEQGTKHRKAPKFLPMLELP